MIPLAPQASEPAALPQSDMIREKPMPDPSRAALVKQWVSKVQSAKKHWKPVFDRMKEDQAFLRGDQWEGCRGSDDLYVANIVQRHVTQRVAALYAKNPKVKVTKRNTLDFQLWDGSMEALQSIQMAIETGLMTPETAALIQDIQQGVSKRMMIEKVSRTLGVIFDHVFGKQTPPLKVQMKQLVRRACATGVGYVRIGYQRVLQRDPADVERINGLTEAISTMERRMKDQQDGELKEDSPELAQLRLQLQDYQGREQQIANEGLVFDFPTSTSIIVDPACRHLRTFTGARWIAEEHILSVDDVKEIYGVDLSQAAATSYEVRGEASAAWAAVRAVTSPSQSKRDLKGCICVWTVWDKTTGQTCTIADGYADFLAEPREPEIFLERFWPIFPLIFNETEDEDGLFPNSDVRLIMPMQREYNRNREGLRQHRIANRPKTAVAAGQLDEDDIAKLENHPPNAVITLNSLPPNGDVNKLLQPIKGPSIDPALYDNGPVFEDLLRTVGQSDASIGAAQGGVTATGDSIAEQNRTVAIASNVDDLDDMLGELARAAGQILLAEMSVETVRKIVGLGAVWPELSRQEIADELLVDVEAGSSGRPNRAAETANMERLIPLLLQIPGINPTWLAKQLITRMDDRLDPQDAIIATLPSIIAQNAMMRGGMPSAGPSDTPEAQGANGANNQQQAPGNAPQSGPPSSLPQRGPFGSMPGA